MSICVACGSEVQGESFCGECGTAVAKTIPGSSTIRVDPAGLALLLGELSRPGLDLTFESGSIRVSSGPLQGHLGLKLDASSLTNNLEWTGALGPLRIGLEGIQTDERGLEVRLRLSR